MSERIMTRPPTDEYRENWDRVFGEREHYETPDVLMGIFGMKRVEDENSQEEAECTK